MYLFSLGPVHGFAEKDYNVKNYKTHKYRKTPVIFNQKSLLMTEPSAQVSLKVQFKCFITWTAEF